MINSKLSIVKPMPNHTRAYGCFVLVRTEIIQFCATSQILFLFIQLFKHISDMQVYIARNTVPSIVLASVIDLYYD